MRRSEAGVAAVVVTAGLGLGLAAVGGLAVEFLVFVCFIGAMAAVLYRIRARDVAARRTLLAVVFLAVAVRLVAVLVVPALSQAQFGIPFTTPSDPSAFDAAAQSLVNTDPTGWVLRRSQGYEPFLAAIYRTFGRTLLVPRLLNVIVAALVVLYAYDLAEALYDETVAKLTAIGVALFPSLVLLSVRIGDDSISLLLLIAGVYYLSGVKRRLDAAESPLLPVGVFLSVSVVLWYFRHQFTLVLLAVAACWLAISLYGRLRRTLHPLERALVLIVVGLISVAVITLTPELLDVVDQIANRWVENNQDVGPGLAGMIRQSGPIKRGVLGVGALYLMPYPPWEVLLSRRLAPGTFFAASSLLLYLGLPLLIVGAKRTLFERDRLTTRAPMLLTAGILVAAIAVIYGGTVPRFRSTIIVFILMVMAVGATSTDRKLTYAVPYLLLGGFTVAYYIVL